MKNIYNYRVYLIISLISLFIGGLLSIFKVYEKSEEIALVAFSFFTIAVVAAAIEELFISRPKILQRLKSLFQIWKK